MIRAKVDRNHGEIVEAFRACGWRVKSTAGLKGWCDLTCQRACGGEVITLLIEVKGPKGKPTEAQMALQMAGWWIHTVRSVADVQALCSGYRRRTA